MTNTTQFFELLEVPDPAAFRDRAPNPPEALASASGHLLRFVGDLAPGAATVCVRFQFNPGVTHPQSRLQMFLGIRTGCAEVGQALADLVTRGPLARFVSLHAVKAPALPAGLTAVCHVFRGHTCLDPLVTSTSNAAVPSRYFSCAPFIPNAQNDYSTLDAVLDGVRGPVVIDIAIEPVQGTNLRTHHSRYLARLQSIGRTWDMQETSPVNEDPLAEDKYSRDEQIVLTPLRQADPAAAEVQREQQSFHEMFGQPLLALQAVVLASTEAAARVVGSTLAEAGFIDGSYGLCVHAHRPTRRGISKALQGIRLIEPQTMVPLRDQADLSELSPLFQLLHVASVEELTGLFRFPVASSSSPCCFRKNTDPPETLSAGDHLQMGWDATVSGIGGKVERGIELNALCRHLFLCGTPGSGKTTAALNLLIQLGRHKVPFLVLEPVKTEFRSLKRLANDPCPEVAEWAKALEIYTPGNEDLMPLRLNPLELLPGVTPSEHIDALEACFKAAMPLSGPLPGILREGLEEVYDMAGPGQPSPTVPSLLAATERALLRKRYSGATYADLRGALDTRLGCLTWGGIGRVFRCTSSLPAMLRLLTTPTIIELDKLSREQACLLTLFLMVRLRQALRTLPRAGGSLRLVLVIDEAHNLVGPDTSAEPSEDNADPKAYASEFVCRMLAEMRAQGVGIIICDQTPSAVAAEVIKHPATKLAFQQCHEADRAAIGAAMLFQATEYEDIARLRPGEAYFFANGYYGPRKIRTVNLHDQIDLNPVADEELKQIIHGEAWYTETTRTRLESSLQSLKAAMDDFEETRLRCVSAAIRLCARLPRALGLSDPSLRRQAVAAVRRDAAALKHRLGEAHRQFRIREYSPLLPSVETTLAAGTALTQRRAVLVARYEKVMRPDTNQCLAILEGLIHNKTKTIK